MASKTILLLLSIILPAIVSAEEFIVGDDMGWTTFFDYQSWAQGKDFRVGDKLGNTLISLLIIKSTSI